MISEFPLFVFTTLGGLSAGAYIANAVFPLDKERKNPWLFDLVCLVLLGLGLIGCLGHLERPAMFMNALANPAAGIAQEAYLSIVFGVLLLVDFIVVLAKRESPRALQIVGAVAAFGMTLVMGMAYTGYLATPAWATPVTVPMFVLGDLVMGFALYAVFAKEAYAKVAFFGAIVALQALAAIAFALEAAHFSGVGLDPVPFIAAIVVAPVLSVVIASVARKKSSIGLAIAVFACSLVGVCIVRWAFYAASIL